MKDLYWGFTDDRLRIGRVLRDFFDQFIWSVEFLYSNIDTLEEIATRDEHQNKHNDIYFVMAF